MIVINMAVIPLNHVYCSNLILGVVNASNRVAHLSLKYQPSLQPTGTRNEHSGRQRHKSVCGHLMVLGCQTPTRDPHLVSKDHCRESDIHGLISSELLTPQSPMYYVYYILWHSHVSHGWRKPYYILMHLSFIMIHEFYTCFVSKTDFNLTLINVHIKP